MATQPQGIRTISEHYRHQEPERIDVQFHGPGDKPLEVHEGYTLWTQDGRCSGCETHYNSNRKHLYCCNCGTEVWLT